VSFEVEELWPRVAALIRSEHAWSLRPLAQLGRPRADRCTWLAEGEPGAVVVKLSANAFALERAASTAAALSLLRSAARTLTPDSLPARNRIGIVSPLAQGRAMVDPWSRLELCLLCLFPSSRPARSLVWRAGKQVSLRRMELELPTEPNADSPTRSSYGGEYWLRRCEGFLVETPTKRLGRVSGIRYGETTNELEVLEVRAGCLKRRITRRPGARPELEHHGPARFRRQGIVNPQSRSSKPLAAGRLMRPAPVRASRQAGCAASAGCRRRCAAARRRVRFRVRAPTRRGP
jgi:hypothetical protein